jgi:hypothetical protein
MKYANDMLLKIIDDNFVINFKIEEINNELVFKFDDEKVCVSLKDETENNYLLFDYMLQFWTLTDDKKHSRGDHIALHNGENLEEKIVDFLFEKVFRGATYKKKVFTNEWKNPIPNLIEILSLVLCIITYYM